MSIHSCQTLVLFFIISQIRPGSYLLMFCNFLRVQISAVRLPREPSNPERLKGFGYAEFDDVDSLLRALSLNEEVRECSNNLNFLLYAYYSWN